MLVKGKDVRLPKKFKDKWIKALRSGNYKQGNGFLLELDGDDDNKEFCCLGVACIVSGIEDSFILNQTLINKYIINYKEKFIKVPKLLHGSSEIGNSDFNIVVKKLTCMNDSGKWSFNRLATYIEKYL